MTFPYLQMRIFCTIKEGCAMFFDVTFLNKERVIEKWD